MRGTPLHSASQHGHIDVIQFLIQEQKCDFTIKTLNGITPLHVACRHRHMEIAVYMVKECVNILHFPCANTLLDEALRGGDDDIVLFLLSKGLKFCTDISKNHRLVSSNLVQPALKVFILGNSESGKSTLVQALMSNLVEGGWFSKLFNPKVTGVEPHTAGIIPYHAHSPSCGRLILYDFAGQYEHYSSSHAAVLENLRCAEGDLVFIVVDISKSKEQLVKEVQYWDSFVSNQYHQEIEKPTAVIVGSHFDVAKFQGKETLSQALSTFPHLNTSMTLDCTRKSSPGLTQVCGHISNNARIRHQLFSVSAQAHFSKSFNSGRV